MGNQILGFDLIVGNVVDPTWPTIASTNTIAPINFHNRITGTVTVKTITVPQAYFNGPLYILNTDAAVGIWDATGNIALAGTFTRFKVFEFLFDTATSLWYPNSVA